MKDSDGQTESYIELAKLNLQINDLIRAKNHLEEASVLAPKVNDPDLDIELHATYSRYYHTQKEWEKALDHINKAIATAGKYGLPAWQIYFARSKLLNKIKENDNVRKDILKCVELIDKLIKNIPDSYKDIFKQRSDVLEAIQYMKTLTESDQ